MERMDPDPQHTFETSDMSSLFAHLGATLLLLLLGLLVPQGQVVNLASDTIHIWTVPGNLISLNNVAFDFLEIAVVR